MVVPVKGGKLAPTYVRDLIGTVTVPGGGTLGGFICLEDPIKGMRQTAGSAGQWEYNGRLYDRVQIRTIGDLLAKRGFEDTSTCAAARLRAERQGRLPF